MERTRQEFGAHSKRRAIAAVVAILVASFALCWYTWTHGTGLGFGVGHLGSEAVFAANKSYLDRAGLWACDHTRDGWRERAEAVNTRTGDRLFIRDPDGKGGACGHRDTDREYHKHRMWGAQDQNAGGWSFHPRGTG